jgi:hypothetical protein
MKLIETIVNEMPNVSKKQRLFFTIFMKTLLSIHGKINFQSLSRYSGLVEKKFRRWYKKPFDFVLFNALAIQKIAKTKSSICAFDACFLEKSGKKTYGLDYFWNACANKVQKGLEVSAAAIIDVSTKTAYPLGASQTPPAEDIKKLTGLKEATRIDFYLSYIRSIQSSIKKFTMIMVFDGFYTKKKFVDGIVEMEFIVVGKLRIDANLKKLYRGPRKKTRGRPKVFEGKCDPQKLEGFLFEEKIDKETVIYSGIFYHCSLKREIKVVAITKADTSKSAIALIFSTDLEMSAVEIYKCYTARFQIEFSFRDAQQFTGFGDCQSRQKEAIDYQVNASLAVITVVKVQEQIDRGNPQKRFVFSMFNHKVKNHNESLISRFISMLGLKLTSVKSNPVYNDMLNYGVISYGYD